MSNYCPAPKHLTSLTLSFWCVCCDSVEDVDQDKEESDQESHPAWDYIRGNNKTGGTSDEKLGLGKMFDQKTILKSIQFVK